MKSPVALLSSFFDDVKRLEPGVEGLNRDLLTVKVRFEHEGYGFLSVALSALCDALDTGLACGRFACIPHFKPVRNGTIPEFLQGMFCKVFDPKTGALLENASVHVIKLLRELLRLFKKVVMSPKRLAKLEAEARYSFIETDNSITELSPSYRLSYLDAVSRLVLKNLDRFNSEDLIMKHGPGTVAERVKPNQKWQALLEALSNRSFLSTKFGLDSMAFKGQCINYYDASSSSSFDELLYESDQINGLVPQHFLGDKAELLVVPKTCTALRTITREPVLNMFIQQGLNTHLRSEILKCSVLSRCLALTNQSINQKLAIEGSIHDNYATIDLSSASDLLSLSLVKRVFASKPRFLTAALDCRSSHCNTISHGVIELRKFAGMGNALTFPIQSIVFSLIVISSILHAKGKRPSFGNVKRVASCIQVYGDDIIVPTEYSRQACDWLTSFGMRVNTKKSFLNGNFKESCGVDAWKGYDVTPIYLRHVPVISAKDPEQIASLTSTQNQLWLRGLWSSSMCLVKHIEEFITLPRVSKATSALGQHNYVDTNVAHKWDGKLQRLVFRAYEVSSITQSDPIDGYAALFASLNKLENRDGQISIVQDSKDWLKRSIPRFRLKLRRRWKPTIVVG